MANQSVNTDMNKTAVIVTKYVESLLGHSHTLWVEIFHHSKKLSHFLK